MAQYKTGRVLVKNGSTLVIAGRGVDWTSIVAGNWFAVQNTNITFNVGSTALATSFTAWSSVTTYSFGTRVSYNGAFFVAVQDTNTNHQPDTATLWWWPCSGWSATLTASYTKASAYNQIYGIVTEFTTNYSLPMPAPGDVEVPAIIARGFTLADDAIKTNAAAAATISIVSEDSTSYTLNIDDGLIASETADSVTLNI